MIRQYAAGTPEHNRRLREPRDDHARHYLGVAITLVGEATTAEDYDALEHSTQTSHNVQ